MWLHTGSIRRLGDPEDVVDEYQNAVWSQADIATSERGRRSNRLAEILSVRLVSSTGRDIGGAPASEDVFVKIRFRTAKINLLLKCAIDLSTKAQIIFRATDDTLRPLEEVGDYEALVRIPKNTLAELSYSVTVSCVFRRQNEDKEHPLVVYNALAFLAYGTEMPDTPASARRLEKVGVLAPRLEWIVRKEEPVARV